MWEQETELFLENQALLPLASLTKTLSLANLEDCVVRFKADCF